MALSARHESVHFMVVPAPRFAPSPSDRNYMVSFSGVAVIEGNFHGNEDGSWKSDILNLNITDMGMDRVLIRVNNDHPLPIIPPGDTGGYAFVPTQGVINASVISQFDAGNLKNAGFAVNNFEINIGRENSNPQGTQTTNILNGMAIHLAVLDKDVRIFRVGYSMNVYGYFAKIYKLIG